MEEYVIERASDRDADAILALYRSLIHAPCSTWSEEYPSRKDVENDLACHAIYAARDRQGKLATVISVFEDDEMENMAPWYEDVTRWIEFARLGVARGHQGKGLARRMLSHAMEISRRKGYQAVRFLVAKSNPIAQRSYNKLDFNVCGEHEMWGHTWLCYQKRL